MRFACLLLVLLVGGFCLAPAQAQVPQTIVVDGVNDFNPLNLLEDDSADTDTSNFCIDDPEGDTPMDIGKVFLTNDNSFLYFGYERLNQRSAPIVRQVRKAPRVPPQQRIVTQKRNETGHRYLFRLGGQPVTRQPDAK